MLDFVTKGLQLFVGSKSKKDLKELTPYVAKVNDEFVKLASLSDEGIRNKTVELKNIIKEKLSGIDSKIQEIQTKATKDASLDIHQKETLFAQVDKLEKDRDQELEKILLEILPQAFAVVKETARRLTQNEKLEVPATDFDHRMAAKYAHIEIQGSTAIWHNKWDAAGTEVTWNMIHYDVQIIGGVVLHQGKIAEMATGEGKTLVATLPAYLNALAGRGVHVVTVNDYLAKRDSEWMAPLFRFHGMQVDCIDKYQPHSEARVAAYNSDITYGTNNEFGFDYLRDNMARSPEELVQRKHHFAMVDEVDSVLVDEARTPLIISGPVPKGDQHEFYELKPMIARLVEVQKKVVQGYLNDAKKLLKEGKEKEAGLPLFRAHRGLPKSKPLIKLLGETGVRSILQKTENIYIAENNKLMPEADDPLYFTIDEKNNQVELTDKGIDLLTADNDDAHFFIMPDISIELNAIEKDTSIPLEARAAKREKLIEDYNAKSQRIHSVNQLLKAYTLFEKDTEYIVVDGKVKIVDEQTGRVMDGRRYSDGLHQSIEAKENCKVEDATQTYATVTLQNYFRMYHKLCGMTGTAETEAGELWEIYKLDVVSIPTNRKIARKDDQDLVFKTVREKFNTVAEDIVKLSTAGRPILVGTTSVEISEVLSRMLKMKGIKHNVLNAKQHSREADIVAEAGQSGAVTIATNMAGRGTDIKLSPEAKAAGGLAIIGTERHESRRVDRQLRGRAGRQGDPGSSQFYVSLEDNLMRLFGSEKIARVMDKLGHEDGDVIQHGMISRSIERAQKKVEENNFGIRKRLLEYDDVMNMQREVIYKRRRNALYGERLEFDILSMYYELADKLIRENKSNGSFDNFNLSVISTFGFQSEIKADELAKGKIETNVDKLYGEAIAHYNQKLKALGEKVLPVMKNILLHRGDAVQNVVVPYRESNKMINVSCDLKELIESEGKTIRTNIEKFASLAFIDGAWKDHLRHMDDLKQSVQNASYKQKDPLLEYKFEGFKSFEQLMFRIENEVVTFLSKGEIPVQDESEVRESRPVAEKPAKRVEEKKAEIHSSLSAGSGNATQEQEPEKLTPMKSEKIFGRNDRVDVQYQDGTIMKDVKFKSVENDVNDGKAMVV